MVVHLINGRVMSVCVDDDEKGRTPEGLLGLQLHTGPPMKVEFRNISDEEAVAAKRTAGVVGLEPPDGLDRQPGSHDSARIQQVLWLELPHGPTEPRLEFDAYEDNRSPGKRSSIPAPATPLSGN
jgi:hypothetical protein